MKTSGDKGLYVNRTPVQTSAVEAQSLKAIKTRKTPLLEPRKDLPLMRSLMIFIRRARSPLVGCCGKWHAGPASEAAGTGNGSSLHLRSPQKSGNTRGKVPPALARKTFLKISPTIDLIFNLCVHLPCRMVKDWEGKVSNHGLAPGPSTLDPASPVLRVNAAWPSNWWTHSPNQPGLGPFCCSFGCPCCATDKQELASHIDAFPVLGSAPSHCPHLSAEQIRFLWWVLNEHIFRAWTAKYIYVLYIIYWFIIEDFLIEQKWTTVFVMGKNRWLQYDQSVKFSDGSLAGFQGLVIQHSLHMTCCHILQKPVSPWC